MWRFILISFGFLGFAFYELSGGADYAPNENSIQARAHDNSNVTVAERAPASKTAPATSVEDLRTTRLEKLETTKEERFEITLASAKSNSFKSQTVTRVASSGENKVALLTAPDGSDPVDAAVSQALSDTASEAAANQSAEKIWPGAIELFSQQQTRRSERRATQASALSSGDIRYVTGNVVNMRGGPGTGFDRVTSLTEGTEVAVLDSTGDGWLMLRVTETGEEGWMADWLVSDPAN